MVAPIEENDDILEDMVMIYIRASISTHMQLLDTLVNSGDIGGGRMAHTHTHTAHYIYEIASVVC